MYQDCPAGYERRTFQSREEEMDVRGTTRAISRDESFHVRVCTCLFTYICAHLSPGHPVHSLCGISADGQAVEEEEGDPLIPPSFPVAANSPRFLFPARSLLHAGAIKAENKTKPSQERMRRRE